MTNNKFPYSKQLEFSLISMCLRDRKNIDIALAYGLDIDCFYGGETRDMFDSLLRLHKRNAFIDLTTFSSDLEVKGSPITYSQIKEIMSRKIEYRESLVAFIDEAKELKNQRSIISKIKTLEEIALTDKTADEKIDLISNEIASVAVRKEDSKTYTETDGYDNFLERLQTNIDNKGTNVVQSGFPSVDKLISFIPGSLHIITAPPAGGKTSYLQQIIDFNAANGKRGLMYSLEMNYDQLMMRKIQTHLGIPTWKLHSGHLTQEEMDSIVEFRSKLSNNVVYNDKPNIDISQLRSTAKVEHNKKKLDFIAVDYIQLIRAAGLKGKREDEEIKFISSELLGLAKDLNVPVIALAQMNRDFHKNEGRRPTMANLHGGSSLEKDALSILILHRPGQFDPTCPHPNAVEAIIAKNRFGNSSSVKMVFDGAKVSFREPTSKDIDNGEVPLFDAEIGSKPKPTSKVKYKSHTNDD
jgi:replicative DNA helicase